MEAMTKATFLASRHAVVSAAGHAVTVEPGVEYTLPKVLFKAAIESGMTPLTPLEVEEDSKDEVGRPMSAADKYEALVEACCVLIIEGEAKNFTQTLKPRVSVVREKVNFDFNRQTLLRAYNEATFRVEQGIYGDNSKQHPDEAERPDTE